jgi:hypothetical protein
MVEKWEGRGWDRVRWEGGGRPAWADSPLAVRAAPASKLLVYDRWLVRGGDWVRKESWTYHLQGRSDVRTVARFRLADHWLNVQRERLRGVAPDTQGRGSGSCLHVGVLWPATQVCARP